MAAQRAHHPGTRRTPAPGGLRERRSVGPTACSKGAAAPFFAFANAPDNTLSGAVAQHEGFIHCLRKPLMTTAINWFEIPVANMDRALSFYEKVLGRTLKREDFGGGVMAVFPY